MFGGGVVGGVLGAAMGAGIGAIFPGIDMALSGGLSLSIPMLTNMGGVLGLSAATVAVSATTVSAVAVAGAAVAGLSIGALGAYLFSKGRPGDNRKQNEQVRSGLRELGYNPKNPKIKDIINDVENYIRKNKLNLGYKELLELLLDFLL